MQISKIYSNRKNKTAVYSDLIYEWEDDISHQIKIPIYSFGRTKETLLRYFFRSLNILKIEKLFQRIESFRKPKSFTLVFELYPRSYFSFQVSSNKIPYIIDFDYRVDLDSFYKTYKNCKLVFISSLEAFNYLRRNQCPLNIVHLPLSISDRYSLNTTAIGNKEFDLIVVRANKVFMEYLDSFAKEFPDFEYVIRKWEGSQIYKNNVYYSNKRGVLGEYSDRTAYINLLKKTKVALYATPGCDENTKRFMNHVTPSLFEFVSSGCRIIARYPHNEETKYFNLSTISPSVNTYEEFRELLVSYLNTTSSEYLNNSEKFIQAVYTSNKVKKLNSILCTINN
ncbi:MAG: hypothetical protein ACM3X7_14105 [Solirubrobacterales bacterium]